MDRLVVAILLIVPAVAVVLLVRYLRYLRSSRQAIGELCREWNAPDVPIGVEETVRWVVAGADGRFAGNDQWWVAFGIEIVGRPSCTRSLKQYMVPDEDTVYGEIGWMFEKMGGTADLAPHLQEGRFLGSMPGIHPDIIYARVTGKMRPIGGWLVAVPPWAIGASSRSQPSPRR